MLIAKTNIVGPKGERILAGDPVPEDWPEEIRDSLVAGGGAEEAADEEEVEDEDEPG